MKGFAEGSNINPDRVPAPRFDHRTVQGNTSIKAEAMPIYLLNTSDRAFDEELLLLCHRL
ncbi:MAG TPA: hypothetical protein V6D12_23250 [Candidatus Obscuribacterales bacterium]